MDVDIYVGVYISNGAMYGCIQINMYDDKLLLLFIIISIISARCRADARGTGSCLSVDNFWNEMD